MAENSFSNQRKIKIVLVDDEKHVRTLMKMILMSMNCDIVGEATDGDEAVKLFKEKKPDITLLDINMPIKTGEETLEEILNVSPEACVIMLTSLSDMGSVENCLTIGAANYIRKDTPMPQIKTLIKETWEQFNEERKSVNV